MTTFEEKKAQILEALENAKSEVEALEMQVEAVYNDVEDAETAEDLQNVLDGWGTYEAKEYVDSVKGYIEDAEAENDDELNELVEAEREAEEEAEAEEEEEADEDEDGEDEDQPKMDPYTEDPLEEVTRICKDEPNYYRKMISDYDTEVVPMGDHYDVIIRRTGEIVEQIW